MSEHVHTEVKQEEPSMLSSALGIVGFIILVVVLIWGLVHAARLSGGWLSTLFNSSAPSIELSAPANVQSGSPFSISWKHSTSEKGLYAFLYQCKKGLVIQTPAPDGSMNSIPCGAAFTVSNTSNSLSLTPFISGMASTSEPVSIIFIPSATGTRAQGSTNVVINAGIAPLTEAQHPETPAQPTQQHAIDNRPADLSVRIISAKVDPSTGMGTVVFDIANVGGKSTGTWYFTAELPTAQGYQYVSPAQNSLQPDGHIENTLNFSQAVPGFVSITVDSSNLVPEVTNTNNFESVPLSMPYYQQPNSNYVPAYQAPINYQPVAMPVQNYAPNYQPVQNYAPVQNPDPVYQPTQSNNQYGSDW